MAENNDVLVKEGIYRKDVFVTSENIRRATYNIKVLFYIGVSISIIIIIKI